MMAWNVDIHRRPLHADADVAARCVQFAQLHAARAAADAPFRRCLVAHLHSMWAFRLLAPEDVEAAMAAVAAAERAEEGSGAA